MKKSRLWYMHTLDGQPASYFEYRGHRSICFIGLRQSAELVPSLEQIRREQRNAIMDATCRAPDWSNSKRYGYVLVSFPALRQGER